MSKLVSRAIEPLLEDLLTTSPAVVLTGPRQVGKTTLAESLTKSNHAIYLDLEREDHLGRLGDIRQYAELNANKLIILDEIHRKPELFVPLRSIIDERRRANHKSGMFLLLGSASIELLRQTSETLTGRIAYCELPPFMLHETGTQNLNKLWLRGGYPESFLAETDDYSLRERKSIQRNIARQDVREFSPQTTPETINNLLLILANGQGQILNKSRLAEGLNIHRSTVQRILELLSGLYLVRILSPWRSNHSRRLVKSPKVYIRDSGLCHAVCNIQSEHALLGHHIAGTSWEGFVIEYIAALMAEKEYDPRFSYYRSQHGAEIDLVVEVDALNVWAIEIKRNPTPNISRGFYSASEDLKPTRKIVVHSGDSDFSIDDVEAISIYELHERLFDYSQA